MDISAAARALRAGGLLLIVDHGSTAPWSWKQDPDTHCPTPTEIVTELDLDPEQWPILRGEVPVTGKGHRAPAHRRRREGHLAGIP